VETRKLQILTEYRRQLVDQRTAESNRLRQVLKTYFPQVLGWFDDLTSAVAGQFLEHWPVLEAAQRARRQTLQKFFSQHNCRSQELIEERIAGIAQGVPATTDPAIVDTSVLKVHHLVLSIALLRESIDKLEQEIRSVCRSHPDFEVFDSFPGVGQALAPRLICAFGTQRERFAAASDVQSFSGIAPVTEQSGNDEWIHFRRACPKFVRQTFHEWAGHSIGSCQWARVYYQQQREGGSEHHAAVRSLAAKWIRIAYCCWKNHTPYDERIYLSSLRRRGSPLAAKLQIAIST
jgi:transposase